MLKIYVYINIFQVFFEKSNVISLKFETWFFGSYSLEGGKMKCFVSSIHFGATGVPGKEASSIASSSGSQFLWAYVSESKGNDLNGTQALYLPAWNNGESVSTLTSDFNFNKNELKTGLIGNARFRKRASRNNFWDLPLLQSPCLNFWARSV